MKGDESLIGTQISYAKPIFVVDRSFPESPEEYRLTRLCNAQGHVSVSMVHSRLSKPTNARNPRMFAKNILYAVLPSPKLSPADKRYFYENALV